MNKIILTTLFFIFGITCCYSEEIITDKFIDEQLSKIEVGKPQKVEPCDFSNIEKVEIPLRIKEKITTSFIGKSYEGQQLEFEVAEDVFYKDKLLVKKGTSATGKIEIIVTRGFAGLPAEIFMNDIKIETLDSSRINSYISKRGFSTTALILPIKWALTFLPPLGSLTNIFVGGNATLTPRRVINVNYYPENINVEN